MSDIEVLAVTSEYYPLIKTGGLADVAGALPDALAQTGVRVRTLLPAYPSVLAKAGGGPVLLELREFFGGPARLLGARSGNAEVILFDAPHLYTRPGGPYVDDRGRDWADNPRRFAALGRIAADIAQGALRGYRPDIVHAHDWQASLALAYLHFSAGGRRPGMVLTIHNLAFQGQFGADVFALLGLPPEAFSIEGLEYYGGVGFLKAGIYYADRVTTVSPSYAAEIRTPESGMGLDGAIRAKGAAMVGIMNGLDGEAWDPASDTAIAAPFDAKRIKARATNKADLQSSLGLDLTPDAPLFGVVSRLTWQKGLDLLLEALPTLLNAGAQLALLGNGDARLEDAFRGAAAQWPGRIACFIGYDEALSHRVQAGSDAFVAPSRFEPCGLTQLSALRYGAVPVVARVGGLADSIIDANPAAVNDAVATGVQFCPATAEMLRVAIERTVALYRMPKVWRRMQLNGMAADFSWRDPARRYAMLFRELIDRTQ
jgi:starch synthase